MNNYYPYDQLPDDPRTIGVPHSAWRTSQRDAILKARALYASGGGFSFLQLPVGSGKSSVASALTLDNYVTVIVATLGLLYQYRDEYGFKVLAGKQQYACGLPDDDERIVRWKGRHGTQPTAADCFHGKMSECDYAAQCPYLVAREVAVNARRAAFTQPMAMLSERVANRRGIVVIDECDGAVEGLLNFAETSVDHATTQRFDLPETPFSHAPMGFGPKGLGGIVEDPQIRMVSNWLDESIHRLSWVNDTYRYAADPDGAKAKRVYEKLIRLQGIVDEGGTSFFMVAGNKAVKTYRKGSYIDGPGFSLRSLDALPVAKRLWQNKTMCVLMSGTIGNADVFASELGIDKYEFHVYPHPVPAEYRPVDDLHFPRMNYAGLQANPGLYLAQAKVTEAWIRSLNPEWRGIVLTSSKYKVDRLREYLREAFGSRVLVPGSVRRGGSESAEDINEFITDPRKGLISVSCIQSWGRGIDLRGDLGRFAIIAGVPNQNHLDPYHLARTSRPGGRKYDDQIVYSAVEQGVARVSRGERDPETGDWLLNRAALVDGKSTTSSAMRVYTASMREAIR